MGLVRVFTNIGSLIIRNFGDVGGPPQGRIEAELDNIIAWAKDAVRCIHRNTSVVGNVGTGLDLLHSFSLPAGSLATNGDYIEGEASGKFTANNNDKRIHFLVNGVTVIGPPLLDIDGAQGWVIRYKIVRVSSTLVRVPVIIGINVLSVTSADVATTLGNSFFFQAGSTDVTVSDLAANALSIDVKGEGVANDDVTQNLSIIKLCQQ